MRPARRVGRPPGTVGFDRWVTQRERELQRSLDDLRRRQTPTTPQDWEVRARERAELAALRLRVAELEAQVDEMVDAAVRCQAKGLAVDYVRAGTGVGRPRRKAKR